MSITLTPDQQRIIEEAINAGLVGSVDEFIKTAVKALPHPEATLEAAAEDSALASDEKTTGMVVENGLLIYRTGKPLPVRLVDEAIYRSRQERFLHLLGSLS